MSTLESAADEPFINAPCCAEEGKREDGEPQSPVVEDLLGFGERGEFEDVDWFFACLGHGLP